MNISIKEILASVYILCLGILLFFVFSYSDLNDLTSYTYIKEKGEALIDYKENNFFLFITIFFIFSILWVLFLGFGSPIAILAGFIFGKWSGTIISVCAFSIGATLLYSLARYYFVDIIKKNLPKKLDPYIKYFKKDAFLYFMIFRLTGGAGIPFAIQNILPVVFNMKLKDYFLSTLIGLIPALFIINALGEGVESLISNNETLGYKNIIYDPLIYWPLIGFGLVIVVSFLFKRIIFKK